MGTIFKGRPGSFKISKGVQSLSVPVMTPTEVFISISSTAKCGIIVSIERLNPFASNSECASAGIGIGGHCDLFTASNFSGSIEFFGKYRRGGAPAILWVSLERRDLPGYSTD
jgi:hypothetical protein